MSITLITITVSFDKNSFLTVGV